MGFDGNIPLLWAPPVRVPDLRRLTRGKEFRDLRSAVAGWMDRFFGVVEREAPWLDRTARDVTDFCETSKYYRHQHVIGKVLAVSFGGLPVVECDRSVTVIYGFDGDLAARLAALKAALTRAGWSGQLDDSTPATFTRLGGRSYLGSYRHRWEPVPALEAPPVLPVKPQDRDEMMHFLNVDWASRSFGDQLQEVSGPSEDARIPPQTRVYQPLEFSRPVGEAGFAQRMARAVAVHEHAASVTLKLSYYHNTDTNTEPHRLRKRRLLPVWF